MYNWYKTLWKTAQQCDLKWDYLKEKERDIVSGERVHINKVMPLCIHVTVQTSVHAASQETLRTVMSLQGRERERERDVTDYFMVLWKANLTADDLF